MKKPKCNSQECNYYLPESKTGFGYCFLHMFEDDHMGFRDLNQDCDIEECWNYPMFQEEVH